MEHFNTPNAEINLGDDNLNNIVLINAGDMEEDETYDYDFDYDPNEMYYELNQRDMFDNTL